MIKLQNVNFKYKNGKDINEGEFISIIGKNGSRKVYYGKDYFWIRKAK